MTEQSWLLTNEFAQVRLELDRKGNGPRLRVEDLQSGTSIYLDALVVAGLVWASEADLERHVDPNAPLRWAAGHDVG
jgi:hypothetical protein